MSKVALIDGNSLMFRSFYATAYTGNLMKTKEGLYTNALFGFCNMFNKILLDSYDYIFVAFDAGKKTFRHQEYSEYKGGRKPLPDELRVQIPIIKDYLDTLSIKHHETFDYEADDLIASMSKVVSSMGSDEIIIITGDKDLLQLVNENIKVYLTKKGVNELDEYNVENFKEKMGFNPIQILDYKGLVGDSSDNLPGIKGVGEKTAIKLINEYGSLEGIYENIDKLTGKTKELFINGKSDAYKCKYLATLVKDAPLPYGKEDIKKPEINYNDLANFYRKYEFYSFLKRIEASPNNEKVTLDEKYELQTSFEKDCFGDGYMTLEVFKSNYYKGDFLGLSLVINNKNYFFFEEDIKNNNVLKQYLENQDYKKYTFDLKMVYFVLKKYGINLKGAIFDLLLAAYIINPNYSNDDFSLVASNFYDCNIPLYEAIYGANSKMNVPEKEIYINYSLKKSHFLLNNSLDIINKIKEIDCFDLFNLELNLSKVLSNMEFVGLKIDRKCLDQVKEVFLENINEISKKIYEISGEEFNINSPVQLGEVLFEKLHLPHSKKNKRGYSTSSEVLEKLAGDYEIAKLVLDFRTYTKLVSTYVLGLEDECDENDFIHPLYKQALTQTGRLSSVEPNIQNMPIRTEVGQVIREAFISRFSEGLIYTSDYSQVELRVLANMSGDTNMVSSFNSGVDFHNKTASQLFEVDINSVTKDMRRTAKAINFGIIYGMSAWGLSEQIGVSPNEANDFINRYFLTFPKAKETLDKFVSDAKELGYSLTMFNRRRYIPELNNSNVNLRQFGERTAMNSPIQGSAADIIKIAMVKISERINELNLKSLMIAQVHDELVFDVYPGELDLLSKEVKIIMEGVINQEVKLITEGGSGKNWFEAK